MVDVDQPHVNDFRSLSQGEWVGGSMGKKPLPGETARKRLGIPMFMGEVT